jgi:Mg-chelatase subunit ChlD
VILSDGKANVSLPGSQGDPGQTLQAAANLAAQAIPALVLDTEPATCAWAVRPNWPRRWVRLA